MVCCEKGWMKMWMISDVRRVPEGMPSCGCGCEREGVAGVNQSGESRAAQHAQHSTAQQDPAHHSGAQHNAIRTQHNAASAPSPLRGGMGGSWCCAA